jgi:hypothetical protein
MNPSTLLDCGCINVGNDVLFRSITVTSRAVVYLNQETHNLHFLGVALDSEGNLSHVYRTVSNGLTLPELVAALHAIAAEAKAVLRNEAREKYGEGTTGWTGE